MSVGWSLDGTWLCPCWPVHSAWEVTPCRGSGPVPGVPSKLPVWVRAAGEGSRPLGPGDSCPQPSAPPPGHLVSLSTRAAPHVTLCLGLSGATRQASPRPQEQAAECGGAGSFAERKSGLASPTPRLEVSCHLTCPATLCLCAPSGRESPVLLTYSPQAVLLASLHLTLRTSCPLWSAPKNWGAPGPTQGPPQETADPIPRMPTPKQRKDPL